VRMTSSSADTPELEQLHRTLNKALLYSHALHVLALAFLVIIGVDMWLWWPEWRVPVAVVAVLVALGTAAVALSIEMHKDLGDDGTVTNETLDRAEYAMTLTTAVAALVAVAWLVMTQPAGFTDGLLLYGRNGMAFLVMGGLVTGALAIVAYLEASEHYKNHRESDSTAWSEDLEAYSVWHLQWHAWSGVVAMLLAVIVYWLLRRKYLGPHEKDMLRKVPTPS